MNWQKHASVRKGGKPYFYRAQGKTGFYSIVWNRWSHTYHATWPTCVNAIEFDSVPKAKRYLDKLEKITGNQARPKHEGEKYVEQHTVST